MILSCRKIEKSFGDKVVLDKIDFDIEDYDRIGIVGKNGAGKSTLANIIYGVLKSDSGQIIEGRKKIKIGYLKQITRDEKRNINFIIQNDNVNKISDFLTLTSNLNLGKVSEWEEGRFDNLSGGEKAKIELANLWVDKYDILILDEPTNNVDLEGVNCIIKEIQKLNCAVLIISHDRYFLDKTVGKIFELKQGKLNVFNGNYTYYKEQKEIQFKNQLKQYTLEVKEQKMIDKQINKLKTWSDKAHRQSGKEGTLSERRQLGLKEFQRVKAKKMDKQIKSREKKLMKMKKEGIEKPKDDNDISLNRFGINEKQGRHLINVNGISKSYGNNIIFENSSFYINRGEKIGLVGGNGAGKTTLIRILLGEEKADDGIVKFNNNDIGYLTQDILDLDENSSVLQILRENPDIDESLARIAFANLGLDTVMLSKKILGMSLGERTRIKIALLIMKKNNMLILDEPTNHLDLKSREELERELIDYEGTLLIVSHDKYLIESVCDKILLIKDKKISRIEKKLSEYEESQNQSLRKAKDRKEKKKLLNKDELMLLDVRISQILNEISKNQPESEKYKLLDEEIKELMRRKKELNLS